MKLDILIPQYNETDDVVKPLLQSIAYQKFIDFNDISVIICNDGSDTLLSEKSLSGWPFSIRYYKEPHRGVSGTRNACLDYSTADYVMWCDADDVFLKTHGLWMVSKFIDANNCDIFVSSFEEECCDGKFVTHVYDDIFVHGKVFKREFLLSNCIRWDQSLTLHEDRYFVRLATSLGKVFYSSTPFYLWKWRDDSVCRSSDDFMRNTFGELLRVNTKLLKELSIRKQDDKLTYNAIDVAFTFFVLTKNDQSFYRINIDAVRAYCMEFRECVLPDETNLIRDAITRFDPDDHLLAEKRTSDYISNVSELIKNSK